MARIRSRKKKPLKVGRPDAYAEESVSRGMAVNGSPGKVGAGGTARRPESKMDSRVLACDVPAILLKKRQGPYTKNLATPLA
jgi:hypothetical protein